MLTLTDPHAADSVLATMSSSAARAQGPEMLRCARRAEARTVFMAYRIGDAVYTDFLVNPERQQGIYDAPDKAAVGEVSLQLKVSRTKASSWISLTDALRHLPLVRIAFLDGDFSIDRTRILAQTLTVLGDELRAAAEPLALNLARQASADTTLRSRLEKLIIGLDPDAAAAARKDFAERNQGVKIRSDAFGHASIDATVPAEHGVFLKKKIAAMRAARLCAKDPRTKGQQEVMALAEIDGFPGAVLVCECGLDDCPQRGVAVTEVTVDLGDATEDADVDDGYGPEALDAAIPLAGTTSASDDAGEVRASDAGEARTAESADESAGREADTSTAPTEPARAEQASIEDPELTVVVDPDNTELPALDGHGTIDPAHADEIAAVTTRRDLPTGLVVVGDGPARPIDPSGHGGLVLPPRGALTYRPSRALREAIFSYDETCRYPLCGRPARECQLDHAVKFDPLDPAAGGWTIAANLIPLCTPDHHRKHLGLWIPTLYTDRSVVWRNPETGQEITTYPR